MDETFKEAGEPTAVRTSAASKWYQTDENRRLVVGSRAAWRARRTSPGILRQRSQCVRRTIRMAEAMFAR